MSNSIEFLERLETVINERASASPDDSYTAQLLAEGAPRIAQKVGEEGVELAIAAATADRGATINEAADLVYHLLVLLCSQGLTLGDVTAELERRHP